MIQVTLKLLGPFRSCVPGPGSDGSRVIELRAGARLGDALLRAALPAGVPRVVLLNGTQRGDDPQLGDGDVVTVFPPIAGGCQNTAWTH